MNFLLKIMGQITGSTRTIREAHHEKERAILEIDKENRKIRKITVKIMKGTTADIARAIGVLE